MFSRFSELSIKHAHCYHTEEMFSKFKFGAGAYDSQDFSNMSNMDTTRDYVTAIAVSSLRLSNAEMANLARNYSKMAREPRSWQRLKPVVVLEKNVESKTNL